MCSTNLLTCLLTYLLICYNINKLTYSQTHNLWKTEKTTTLQKTTQAAVHKCRQARKILKNCSLQTNIWIMLCCSFDITHWNIWDSSVVDRYVVDACQWCSTGAVVHILSRPRSWKHTSIRSTVGSNSSLEYSVLCRTLYCQGYLVSVVVGKLKDCCNTHGSW